MDKRIRRALTTLQSKGFVKPCGDHCCRQCNPKGYMVPLDVGHSGGGSGSGGRVQKPSKFTRIQPYPSVCVASRVASLAGCKPRDVNRYVLQERLRKQAASAPTQASSSSFHYFIAYKPRGVTSMRKMGGGGFGRTCRDFARSGMCPYGSSCRFRHPGTFQVQSVFHTLPLNWPPVPHVGRLDVATEGLLLFTDDGPLQSALLDKTPARTPARATIAADSNEEVGVRKVYLVQVSREGAEREGFVEQEEGGQQQCDGAVATSNPKPTGRRDNSGGTVDTGAEVGTVLLPCDGRVGANESVPGTAGVVTEAMLHSIRQPLHYDDDDVTKTTQPAAVTVVSPAELGLFGGYCVCRVRLASVLLLEPRVCDSQLMCCLAYVCSRAPAEHTPTVPAALNSNV